MTKTTFLFIFLCLTLVRAQNISSPSDSMLNMEFDTLFKEWRNSLTDDKPLAHIYSNAYSLKADLEKDTIKKALSYHILSLSAPDFEQSIAYLDQLITYTQSYDTGTYPALAYFLKSELQYYEHEYRNAIDNALLANENLRKYPDSQLKYVVKCHIAIIRARIGEHREAIEYYKESLAYFSKNNQEYYETTLFGLTESYFALKKLDSMAYYAKIGHKASMKSKSKNYGYFVYTYGTLAHENGNYHAALDSLKKSLPMFVALDHKANVALNYYWLGASKEKLGDTLGAISNYKAVDSLFNITNSVPLELRVTWVKLIEYSRAKDKENDELKYARKLIKVDSILNEDYKYLSENITNKFVVPNIIEGEESKLLRLLKEKEKGLMWVYTLAVALVVGLILFIVHRRREMKRLTKYQLVIQRLESETVENQPKTNNKLNLSQEIIDMIENGLISFEEDKEFLENNLTVGEVAKRIGTNRKYLSQFINYNRGIKFPDYVNSLRIDYALKRFETNEGNFRVWRMNAIAKAIGFSSREYYVKAFEKFTNMKPNEYLIQRKKAKEKARNS